ncbi:MAG: hypothetical protein AAAC48_25445, partial [Phyllobacterium sp.]|uniref:hypothetical protein n=1 Tax=Phyllobacterium sp. TaxID=1871046 RepID=UPI0030F1E860
TRCSRASVWDLDAHQANTLKERLSTFTNIPIIVSPPGVDNDIVINASPAWRRRTAFLSI